MTWGLPGQQALLAPPTQVPTPGHAMPCSTWTAQLSMDLPPSGRLTAQLAPRTHHRVRMAIIPISFLRPVPSGASYRRQWATTVWWIQSAPQQTRAAASSRCRAVARKASSHRGRLAELRTLMRANDVLNALGPASALANGSCTSACSSSSVSTAREAAARRGGRTRGGERGYPVRCSGVLGTRATQQQQLLHVLPEAAGPSTAPTCDQAAGEGHHAVQAAKAVPVPLHEPLDHQQHRAQPQRRRQRLYRRFGLHDSCRQALIREEAASGGQQVGACTPLNAN